MTTARQKVLSHLKKTRSASAREIGRALNLSTPNVRHHLGILTADGRLEVVSVHLHGERGRPEKLYSLSQSALGDNLSVLANALLREKVDFQAVGERIAQSQGLTAISNQSMPKRLALLIDKLNEMHYQARWEAGAEGPRIIFGRCPYSKIIEQHPGLCKVDATLLEISLGRPISAITKSESGLRGSCPFAFRVG